MTAIPAATFIVYNGGQARLALWLSEERSVRTAEARAALPAGTITIDADECCAVADGKGRFLSTGLAGAFPADESVVLPAYIIAGPGLPPLIPGGGRVLAGQDEVNRNPVDFHAIDSTGALFRWDSIGDSVSDFAWETTGRTEATEPVFPVTAWR